jgi:polyisoprenoid-binding protein YceI
MTKSIVAKIPGFVAGTWDIDPICSEVSFAMSHFTVGKARGRFNRFTGRIVTDQEFGRSSVNVTIDAATIATGGAKTDDHVRSGRFLDVENFPKISFRSTAVHFDGKGFVVQGDLTIRSTTRTVVLEMDVAAFTPDFDGGTRAHFNATTQVSRNHFGVRPTGPLELMDNALIIGDTVRITLRIEAVLRSGKSAA